MAGKKKLGLKATLMLTSTDMMVGSMFIIPVMGYISASFGGADPSMVMTIVSLMAIPGILIVGKLSEYVSKKTLLVIGTILFAVSGAAGGLCSTLQGIIITRAIMGLGAGVLITLPSAFITQLFDGQERVTLLGWAQAVGSIFAVIASTLGGILGVIDWHLCFYVCMAYVILAAFQILKVPNVPPEKKDEALQSQSGEKEKMGSKVWIFCLAMMFVMTVTSVFQTRLSMFVIGNGYATSVEAGLVTSIMTAIGFCLNLAFGKIFAGLKRYTAFVSPLLFGTGILCMFFAQDMSLCYLAGAFMGGSAITFPYYVGRVSMAVPKSRHTMAISLIAVFQFLGQFLATPVLSLYAALNITDYRMQFLVTALACYVFAVVVIIYILSTRKTEDKVVEEALKQQSAETSTDVEPAKG